MLIIEISNKTEENLPQNFQNIFYKILKSDNKISKELLPVLPYSKLSQAKIGYKEISFIHNLEMKKVYEVKSKSIICIELLRQSNETTFLTKHIVHNIGNLLTTINNNSFYLESLIPKSFKDDSEIVNIIKNIKSTAENAGKMARSYLNFQYLMRTANQKDFLFKELVKECYNVLDYSFKRYFINTKLIEQNENVVSNKDKHLITQVMLAIYINAIDAFAGKYSSKPDANRSNGRIIKTTISSSDKENNIMIYDNGPGIKKDYLENIFIPGFSTKYNGTGLGLAMAKEIIESLHGKVEIFSEPGSYTKINIALKKI